MDALRFDRLTRRLVLWSVLGSSLAAGSAADGVDAAKVSKRKRCKRKKRDFCAGRCCARPQRCDNAVCVSSCDNTFQCPPQGPVDSFSCNSDDSCFCGETPGGKSACVALPSSPACNDFPACGNGTRCPAGQVCFTCACQGMAFVPDFRCAPPC